jgi:hypothetical protein
MPGRRDFGWTLTVTLTPPGRGRQKLVKAGIASSR